jgi:hypothetical protein
MSFLSNTNSEFISAKLTKKGRNAIAKGNFSIDYFQIGDSEFDYTNPFSGFTGAGSTPHQKVFSPFDIESGVKYPYKLDTSTNSTTYGTPIDDSTTEIIRNVMGPAGFVSEFIEYDSPNQTGTTIACYTESISLSGLTGGTTTINVSSGNTYQNCDYITLSLNQFGGTDPNAPVVTGSSNSFIYRITGITGNTLQLDRTLPDLSSLSGGAQITCNKCEIEYSECSEIDYTSQLNPWTLNVVWGQKPIGADYPIVDEGLTGYSSNVFVSTKELLGYTSTGQTFTNYTGTTLTYPTSFYNCFEEQVLVNPNEQRCIAILHYSELGDLTIDPDRFFKYDDYLSYDDGDLDSIVEDQDENPLTDREYFEVYIPFILYHRNTGTTIGARFYMDTEDNYVKSTKNDRHQLLFKYLVDEQGYKVGKVFPNNKIVVFDDQEIVASLDYRSNRKFTLGAPKVGLTPSYDSAANSILSGSTGQTIWVTYMVSYSNSSSPLNSLPCNYFSKIQGTEIPSQVTIKFSGDTFQHLKTAFSGLTEGYLCRRFYVLVQRTDADDIPQPDMWKILEYTTDLGGNGTTFISDADITGYTFTITESDYDGASFFDLETFLGTDYLLSTSATTEPQFGDEQPFPGSIKLVRATDLETMNFSINLPSTQFLETQNPTYSVGSTKKITDIALLNTNKETLVVAKTSIPITRVGSQVISVKIDF